MKWGPWAWLIGGAVALWLMTRSSGSSVPGIPPGPAPSGTSAYIDRLWEVQQAALPAIKATWTKAKLRAVTREAAKALGIPPEWPWGVMYGESRWVPVGVYGSDPDKAKGVPSTAYGMGQILRSRFGSEARAEPRITWSHEELIDPRKTIWTIAASYARAVRKHGVEELEADGGQLLGDWWAGKGRGARKARHIREKGPDVWGATDNELTGEAPGGFGAIV